MWTQWQATAADMVKPNGRQSAEAGFKYVDLNYHAKENAKRLNGGILPPSKSFRTSDFPNKDVWTAENLPEILFYLIPRQDPLLAVKPEKRVRDDGVTLRHYAALPDYISTEVEGWLVQAWKSTDSRIAIKDIRDRMVADDDYFGHKIKIPPANVISNDCYRSCRKILGMFSPQAQHNIPTRSTVEIVEILSYEKIWMNTVLSRSVQYPDRLIRVKFVRGDGDENAQYHVVPLEVTPENYDYATFPLDYFCPQGFNPHVVGSIERHIAPAMSTFFDIQHKAALHGHDDWRRLEKECLPESWYVRTKDGAPVKNTFDGGCETCTWYPGHDTISPQPAKINFNYPNQWYIAQRPRLDNANPLKRPREVETQERATPRRIRWIREVPQLTPLERDNIFKIKYLEEEEEYEGLWSTDTEVELDSEEPFRVGTMTNLGRPLNEYELPYAEFRTPNLNRQQVAPNGSINQTVNHRLSDSVATSAPVQCAPPQAADSPPIGYMRNYFVQAPPFGVMGTSSTFNTRAESTYGDHRSLLVPQPLPTSSTLQQQSMNSLQNHNAGLYSAVGFGPLLDYVYSPGSSTYANNFTIANGLADTNFAAGDPPITPPRNNQSDSLSQLMFTNELNRYTYLSEFGFDTVNQSPLAELNTTQSPTNSVYPVSPLLGPASTRRLDPIDPDETEDEIDEVRR